MQNIDNAIEVRNLYKSFKVVYDKPQTLKERLVSIGKKNNVERRLILNDITLDVKKGETVALIGTNGSGKSTLLKLMTKILYPTKGSLETNGKLTSLLELGAGFHPDFTGRENIYFNASIFGLTRKEIDERIDKIIEFSELGDFIDNPVRTYSSGMYMRLAFSVAINVDAEILLIDEILGVGDQYFQEKCFKKLEELRDSNKTVVIVSHSLDTLKELCTRAVWIYKGKVQLDGEPEYVIDRYLKQVVEDHKENSKNVVLEKKEHYIGRVVIDAPLDNGVYQKQNGVLAIHGWELSESAESKVNICIDNKAIDGITRSERPDLMIIYENQFGGYATNPFAGYNAEFDLNSLEKGIHHLTVKVYDERENLICMDERKFEIV